MSDDIRGDLPAHMDDEAGHQQTRDTVCPPPTSRHTDQSEEGTGGGNRVEPGVLGIGQQGVGLDTCTDPLLVAGHDLVPDDADGGGCHAQSEVARAPVVHELVHAHETGEDRTAPDDERHAETRHVLGTFVPVGI
jgi:hypothetical protein